MTETKPAQITLSPQQRQAWIDMVAEVSAELGMATPPVVEFDCTSEMRGAMRYHHQHDTVTVFGGWVSAEPDPESLASKALAAHELGHRLDRDRLRRRRGVLLAGYLVLCGAAAAAVAPALAESWANPGRFGPMMPTWVAWVPTVLILVAASWMAALRWPDENRADAVAASLYGPQGVHAFLDVFAEHAGRSASWISPTHPSHRMRRARHPQ